MAPGVCAMSFRAFLRSSDLLRFRLTPTIIPSTALLAAKSRPNYRAKGRSYCTDAKSPQTPVPLLYEATDEITVKYIQGLPHITVPLPSRCEKCRFALMPVTHKVYNFVEMLKLEDRGVDRVVILNEEGIRIASTCTIESLMDEPFWLCINDKKYKVVPPQRKRATTEDLSKLGDVKALVGQLYEALHVGEYHVNREQELVMKLEELQFQLSEMEGIQEKLNRDAIRRNNILAWAGLGYMAIQFGILARLTWWEYSWDIMEPVTYFVTYGTAMTVYAYYCVTKMEYNYDDVKDRLYLIFVHKKAKKIRFDINAYNELKRQVFDIEYDLRRLRDPMNIQFAPNIAKGYSRKVPPYTAYTEAENKPNDDSDGSSSSGGPPFHSSTLILTSKSITDRLAEVFSTNKRKKKDE